jgi:hypothetical protein
MRKLIIFSLLLFGFTAFADREPPEPLCKKVRHNWGEGGIIELTEDIRVINRGPEPKWTDTAKSRDFHITVRMEEPASYRDIPAGTVFDALPHLNREYVDGTQSIQLQSESGHVLMQITCRESDAQDICSWPHFMEIHGDLFRLGQDCIHLQELPVSYTPEDEGHEAGPVAL